jgi:hypothetical protein
MIHEEFKKTLDDIKRGIQLNSEIRAATIDNTISLLREMEKTVKEELAVSLIKEELRILKELYGLIKTYNIEVKILKGIQEGFTKDMLSELIGDIHVETSLKEIEVGLVEKDIPKFRGIDGINYGPYKRGDIILINKSDYILLKEKGFIKEVYIEK